MGMGSSTKEVTVPNLVGMNVDEAKTKLESMNLVLVEAGTEESDEPEGTILKSNVEAGTKVKENSEIRVIISGGATKIKMPDLVEDDLDTAKTILKSYGLKISSSTEDYSDDIPKGKIIRQTPEKDTDVDEDTEITVVISKGPKIRKNTVPSVIGMSEEEAKNKIISSGFKVDSVTQKIEDQSQNGIVLGQSVEGGETITAGKTITITVGIYSEPQKNDTENKKPNTNSNNTNNNANADKNNENAENGSTTGEENNKPESEGPDTETSSKPAGPWDENPGENNSPNNSTTRTHN